MENPFEPTPIPERKPNPPREELLRPNPEDIDKGIDALMEGVRLGLYTPEYSDKEVIVKDKSGKIVHLDANPRNFKAELEGWLARKNREDINNYKGNA